jgi:hypothetical protein
MALCCADDNGWYEIGNAKDGDPIEIFNSNPIFKRHRDLMSAGRVHELEHCRNCSIPLARENTNYRPSASHDGPIRETSGPVSHPV